LRCDIDIVSAGGNCNCGQALFKEIKEKVEEKCLKE
jgi:hypothetical protein